MKNLDYVLKHRSSDAYRFQYIVPKAIGKRLPLPSLSNKLVKITFWSKPANESDSSFTLTSGAIDIDALVAKTGVEANSF